MSRGLPAEIEDSTNQENNAESDLTDVHEVADNIHSVSLTIQIGSTKIVSSSTIVFNNTHDVLLLSAQ